MKQKKIVVEQKVVDDHYVQKYIWTVIDEDNKVYHRGETNTREEALKAGRKKL